MSAVFQELRKGTTGALDKAKLMINDASQRSGLSLGKNGSQDGLVTDAEAAGGGDSGGSGNDDSQQPIDRLEELSEYCPQLTFQQRLIGFAVSFSLGYMIAFFSFRFFVELVEGYPIPFALNYTFGHILQLLASTFLCGPKRQFRNMFDEKRRTTSTVYISCLGLVLVVIFIPFPGPLKLLLLLSLTMVQFCSSVWYSLSYIPYGRRTALRILKNALGIEDDTSTGGIAGYTGIQLGR